MVMRTLAAQFPDTSVVDFHKYFSNSFVRTPEGWAYITEINNNDGVIYLQFTSSAWTSGILASKSLYNFICDLSPIREGHYQSGPIGVYVTNIASHGGNMVKKGLVADRMHVDRRYWKQFLINHGLFSPGISKYVVKMSDFKKQFLSLFWKMGTTVTNLPLDRHIKKFFTRKTWQTYALSPEFCLTKFPKLTVWYYDYPLGYLVSGKGPLVLIPIPKVWEKFSVETIDFCSREGVELHG